MRRILQRGISASDAIDDVCRSAGVPFGLVAGPIVSRVLRVTGGSDTAMPIASSVPAALWRPVTLTEARHRPALAITAAQRHAS